MSNRLTGGKALVGALDAENDIDAGTTLTAGTTVTAGTDLVAGGDVTGDLTHRQVVAGSTAASLPNAGVSTLANSTAGGILALTLAAPVAGVEKTLIVPAALSTSTGTDSVTVQCSTGVVFTSTAGSDNLATFDDQGEALRLVGLSASKWGVVGNIGSVTLSTA